MGRIQQLRKLLESHVFQGNVGIGHTRWATHGFVNQVNAHPHRAGSLYLVHNGIIENEAELRNWLQETRGIHCESQTDSELIAHILNHFWDAWGDPLKAIQNTVDRLEGLLPASSFTKIILRSFGPLKAVFR